MRHSVLVVVVVAAAAAVVGCAVLLLMSLTVAMMELVPFAMTKMVPQSTTSRHYHSLGWLCSHGERPWLETLPPYLRRYDDCDETIGRYWYW